MRQYVLGFAPEEFNFGRTGKLRCVSRDQRNRFVGQSGWWKPASSFPKNQNRWDSVIRLSCAADSKV
jgi:hypothetical protein